jgi:epoxyqueuosine reductase
MDAGRIKAFIQSTATELGCLHVGFSKAEFLADEAPRLTNWLKSNMHGNMSYMENHFDMRLDPTILVPGAKTVISFLFNYFPEQSMDDSGLQLSKYAYGEDYHFVIKDKLKALTNALTKSIGAIEGRIFVDSAPILEKAWAAKSGLGWIGKNSNLINPKAGSFYFLAEWICDLALEPDGPMKDYCGTCTKCIDACPTDAIVAPYVVDGSKCISYATIELRDANLPDYFKGKMNNWMYGCDICQDVCPWNRFATAHSEPRFLPNTKLFSLTTNDWEDLSHDLFDELFRRSAVKRTKYEGLKRNIRFIQQEK